MENWVKNQYWLASSWTRRVCCIILTVLDWIFYQVCTNEIKEYDSQEQTSYDDLLDGVRSPYFNPYTLSSNTDRKVVGHERLDYNIPLPIRFRCGDQLMSYSTVHYNALLYMID